MSMRKVFSTLGPKGHSRDLSWGYIWSNRKTSQGRHVFLEYYSVKGGGWHRLRRHDSMFCAGTIHYWCPVELPACRRMIIWPRQTETDSWVVVGVDLGFSRQNRCEILHALHKDWWGWLVPVAARSPENIGWMRFWQIRVCYVKLKRLVRSISSSSEEYGLVRWGTARLPDPPSQYSHRDRVVFVL